MTTTSSAGLGKLPGLPLLNITSAPQPVPVGNGCTLINPSSIPITLSLDPVVSASNSFQLQPNGASLPITSGPLFASSASPANLIVLPVVLNVFNPNVLNAPAGNIQLLSQNPTVPTTSYAFSFPKGIKAIIVSFITASATLPNLFVEGGHSGWPYYNTQPFYLASSFAGNHTYTAVIPVFSVDSNGVSIQVTNVAGNLIVEGSYEEIQESDFYHGNLQVVNVALGAPGSTPILAGPVRILNATMYRTGAGVFGNLELNNSLEVIMTVNDEGTLVDRVFPPNYIVPAGSALILAQGGTGGVGCDITYAYP